MKLKLAVCIFVAVFLSAVIFKVNQVEYIPEYDSGEKSLQAVNSENITEIKTEAETWHPGYPDFRCKKRGNR